MLWPTSPKIVLDPANVLQKAGEDLFVKYIRVIPMPKNLFLIVQH